MDKFWGPVWPVAAEIALWWVLSSPDNPLDPCERKHEGDFWVNSVGLTPETLVGSCRPSIYPSIPDWNFRLAELSSIDCKVEDWNLCDFRESWESLFWGKCEISSFQSTGDTKCFWVVTDCRIIRAHCVPVKRDRLQPLTLTMQVIHPMRCNNNSSCKINVSNNYTSISSEDHASDTSNALQQQHLLWRKRLWVVAK